MAKAKPQLNNLSGLIGNLVILNTKNGTILRTAPQHNPRRHRSTAEQTNNERFRLARALARQLHTAYQLGYHADNKRPYDLFLTHLLTQVVKTRPRTTPLPTTHTSIGQYTPDPTRPDLPEIYPDLNALRVSQGTLRHITQPQLTITNSTLTLTWHNNTNTRNTSPDDIIYLVIYNPSNKTALTIQAHRADTHIQITLPPEHTNTTNHYYLGCTNAALTLAADSLHLTPTTK